MEYADEELRQIWQKASPAPSPRSPSEWRMDAFHALIKWSGYGKRTEYGWDVDYITPRSMGGRGDMGNLRPMHWMNNTARQEG